jgi:hypothetical protein
MNQPDPKQTLQRLLGPVELEVAGHNADAAVPGLKAHLEGCPACREEHESLLAFVQGDAPHP